MTMVFTCLVMINFCLLNFFKIRSRVFAGGADEVGGEFVTFIFVAANLAAPDGFATRAGGGCLRFRFDVLMVVGIGCGGRIIQHIHIGDSGDKEAVGAQVDFLRDPAGDIGVGAFVDNHGTVGSALGGCEAGEFIHVFPGLEAEAFEQFKIGILTDYGGGKFLAGGNHIAGVVQFVDGNGYLIGVGGYLCDGVDDAAIVLAIQIGGQDIETIGNIEHGFGVHMLSSSL